MNENKNIQQIIDDLNSLGKGRIGNLAVTCGKAIKELSNPAALNAYLHIPGLTPESYIDGNKRYREYLSGFLKKLGFEKWAEEEAARIWDTYRTKPFDFDNILY